MHKNITTNQVLLFGIATALFLLTAASFYLLQDPTAPLPFSAPPPINTILPVPPSPTPTPQPTSTPVPTRQTSYTPFASLGTPASGTPLGVTDTPGAGTALPSGTASLTLPATTSTFQPGVTPTITLTPSPVTYTPIPSVTPIPGSGEHVVTGRVLQNATPVANVIVRFADDEAPRPGLTDSGGHYRFITLAPGTNFVLEFSRSDNPQLTPASQVATNAWIEGNLPTGVDIITLPDLDMSLNLDGVIFESQTPVDGATFSAAFINPNNPLQFNWSVYSQGEYYFVEIGPIGSDAPIFVSDDTALSTLMWDGTLDSGLHIPEGSYWWHVGSWKNLGAFKFYIISANKELMFNP